MSDGPCVFKLLERLGGQLHMKTSCESFVYAEEDWTYCPYCGCEIKVAPEEERR